MSEEKTPLEGCHIVWLSHYADWWRKFCVENNFITYNDVLVYLTANYNATIVKCNHDQMMILFSDEESLLQFRFSWMDK
jgi:hypothetical protein